ncbi:uncharacterized protein [Typha angustifolia]|uniref:uncharacterized protein n=1 Tax=Typha angustifolia TaxID=59011 RepID=UPI003C2E102E
MEEERSTSVSSPSSADGGVTGTIDLRQRSSTHVDLTGGVHLLPCSIKHDGPCPVSNYFKPRKTGVEVDGFEVEEAFFRGRKLQGVTVPLPAGYRGYVLEKKKLEKENEVASPDGNSSNWSSRAEFQSLTYWNHDVLPSPDDPLLRSFHWFAVANALHKPVTVEELASASALLNQKS